MGHMKRTAAIVGFGIVVLFVMGMPVQAADTIAFDDITSAERVSFTNYEGFEWDNFGVATYDHKGAYTGYYNANVSGDYVAFNQWGVPAAVSRDNPFCLVGAHFTAAWRNGLQILAEGYLEGDLVHSRTFTVCTCDPTWVSFDWGYVDHVVFSTSGGESAGYAQNSFQFAMDNMVYHTPAPGAILLAGMGAGLTGWLRRRRAL